ncbi:SP_0198 family lipoprotein [Streptococcus cristatus]|jgi:putative lipoprotein|uniref:SP_0198 family lipoprotein n=1 Tax=Streptococcus cristatus TaxID=45634 RepID=UPI0028D4CCF6|nr:SP_0198 family lipoprotein [Streptococcus cristatus]
MKVSKKLVLSALTAMTAFVLVACGNSGQNPSNQAAQSQASSSVSQSTETVSSSSNTNSSANTSSSEASTASQTAASDLDGTYKATHEGDALTLEVSGNKGTLSKVERDGEQEIEQVQVDPTNQTMIVGDDVKRYRVEGNQLTLEDLSQENDDDDTIVFTKQ